MDNKKMDEQLVKLIQGWPINDIYKHVSAGQ